MSEPKPLLAPQKPAVTTPHLWTGERFVADPWQDLADDADVPASGNIIMSPKRWRAERAALIARALPTGLRIAPADTLDPAIDDLDRLGLIALVFPKFTDGRAYSTARRLREAWHFKAELRATGDVLLDQLPHMLRSGFDSFEIVNAATISALQRAALPAVSRTYQRNVGGDAFGWRQRPPAAKSRTAAE